MELGDYDPHENSQILLAHRATIARSMTDLTPANENPWYVLATIHGEQDSARIDRAVHTKNRNTWNRFMVSRLDEVELDRLKGRFVDADLVPLSEKERLELNSKMKMRGHSLPGTSGTVSFRKTDFTYPAVFSNFLFPNYVSAEQSVFRKDADFSRAECRSFIDFDSAVFHGNFSFERASVKGGANFSSTTFYWNADFRSSAFEGDAYFQSASFRRRANFREVTFQRIAAFTDGKFEGAADFMGAPRSTAKGGVPSSRLDGVLSSRNGDEEAILTATLSTSDDVSRSTKREFGDIANFSRVSFADRVSFVNRVFFSLTFFDRASFRTHPPKFADAELHQGTTWRDTRWPGDPSPKDADDHIDAYAQLRLRMNEIQDHDAELDFFARELAAKKVKAGWSFAGLVILLYQALSDCGRSVGRPIAWFGGLIGTFGPVFHAPLIGSGKAESLWSFYGFAAASLTGLLGTRREFFRGLTETLPGWMQAVSGGLSLAGAVLVFLMALAIRNRFRIR